MKYVIVLIAGSFGMLIGGCLFLLGMFILCNGGRVPEGLVAVFGGLTLWLLGSQFPRFPKR